MAVRRYTLGRRPECTIVVAHASVSGQHALIHDEGHRICIEDLGSTNGTVVRETRLVQGAPAAVELGEPITIGNTRGVLRRRGFDLVWVPEEEAAAATSMVQRAAIVLAPQVCQEDALRKSIREIESLVRDADGALAELESRGWWDRLWANNTRDVARAMANVVKIQRYTLALFVAALQIHGRNMQILGVIREELSRLSTNIESVSAEVGDQAEVQLGILATLEQIALSLDHQLSMAQLEQQMQQQHQLLESRLARLEREHSALDESLRKHSRVASRGSGNKDPVRAGPPAPATRRGWKGWMWWLAVISLVAVATTIAWLAARV